MKTIERACIIDDDPIFVFGAKIILRNSNFCSQVEVYNNGKEALEHLVPAINTEDNFPEVVFLDLNMPVMDGWEFLEEFSKFPNASKLSIYVLSSSIDSRDVIRSKAYTIVTDFIEKPLSNEKIMRLIDQLASRDR